MLRTISNPIKFASDCIFSILESDIIGAKKTARIRGPLGYIDLEIPESVNCIFQDGLLRISPLQTKSQLSKQEKAKVGTFRSLVLSCIEGTTKYHSRSVIFTGTGIDVKIVGKMLNLEIGKSHLVPVDIPASLSCSIESSDIKKIILGVKGIDKAQVGKFIRELSDLVKNPYKNGKHIYPGDRELITREGKKKK